MHGQMGEQVIPDEKQRAKYFSIFGAFCAYVTLKYKNKHGVFQPLYNRHFQLRISAPVLHSQTPL